MKIQKHCIIFTTIIATVINLLLAVNIVSAKTPRIRINRSPNSASRTNIVGTRLRGFLKNKDNHAQNRKEQRHISSGEILQAVREGKITRQNRFGKDGYRRIKYEGKRASVITQNGKIVTLIRHGNSKSQKDRNTQESAKESRQIPFSKKHLK
jgi:hypothetical protein